MFNNKLIAYWFMRIILFLWIIGIFYVSLTPNPKRDFHLYYTLGPLALHIIAFFVLFILLYLSFPLFKGTKFIRLFSFWGVTAIVSLSKELVQLLVKGRTFSMEDILVDAASALMAAIIIGILEKKREGIGLGLI
jgi:VanZ family protein